jgi:hypothetical protein
MKKADPILDRILDRLESRSSLSPYNRPWNEWTAKEQLEEYENEMRLVELEEQVAAGSASTSDLLPCKPGTQWEQITITLTDDETVRIKTPKDEKPYTFQMLGMAHAQSPSKPKGMWKALMLFAESDGFVKGSLSDHKRLLDKHLQELFGIDESIYTGHAKRTGGHKTRIVFRSEVHRSTMAPTTRWQEPREDIDEDALLAAIEARRNI